MAKIFHISDDNPVPFTELVDIDPRYNTVKPSSARTPVTVNGCYYQKWQYTDVTKIQFLSDYVCDVKVYKNTGALVSTIVPTQVVTNILNQTFQVYEFELDFSDYGYGVFYAEIIYTDDDLAPHIWQSELWKTADKWPDTMLWEYKNSYNARSVVYETGIEFNFRVESQVREFTPEFDSEVYIDQTHNATQLSSIPYKRYRLVTQYLPDWALNIFNSILNVDEKKGDGEYYEKPEGSKFEMNRVDGYEYGYASIDIIPINNFFLQRLIVDDMANGEYVIYPKRLQWIDNVIDRTIVGKMRINTLLKRIDIVNKSASNFTMKVGTTDGGNELGEKVVTSADETAVLLLYKLFDSDQTIYITGIDGVTINLFVMYDQDDEVAVNISGGGSSFRWPKGFEGYWSEVDDGDLEATWDLGSGLGKTGTKYENCAIQDGRNGTTNMLGAYMVGVDSLSGVDVQLNTQTGDNTKAIAKTNLPSTGVGLFANYVNTLPGDQNPANNQKVARAGSHGGAFALNYEVNRAPDSVADNIGVSFPLGDGTPFDVRPKSFKKLPFKAITD